MDGAQATPMSVLHYRLTRADALAWETLPREMKGLRTLAFYFWLGCSGAALAALPQSLAGNWPSLRFALMALAMLALFGAAWIALGRILSHWRAGRRVPEPQQWTLEDWPDRLVARGAGGTMSVTAADISGLLRTPSHVFVGLGGGDVLIVPADAFPDTGSCQRFVERWDIASRNAVA